MYGTPKDVEGECNAHLYISDDYGDNHATMRCQLPSGHDGEHQEIFKRYDKPVVVRWSVDERAIEEADAKECAERDQQARKVCAELLGDKREVVITQEQLNAIDPGIKLWNEQIESPITLFIDDVNWYCLKFGDDPPERFSVVYSRDDY